MTIDDARQMVHAPSDAFSAGQWCEAANELHWQLCRAEDILYKAVAPRRPDGTYNYSREAFEQMANNYFAAANR